jgi:hypothetical protein
MNNTTNLNRLELDQPDIDSSNPAQETTGELSPQQEMPTDFKETCQIEMGNGSKIFLGSCSRPVEFLCNLAIQMKQDILDGSKATKLNGMVG